MICMPLFCFAQIPPIKWQYTYGGSLSDEASLIKPTSDKGFIVTGLSSSTDGDVTGNHGGDDHWIIKLDSLGNMQWNRAYGGTSADKGYSILQTASGDFVFTGYEASSDGDVSENNGSADFWIVKVNSTGDIIWERSYGGSSADNPYCIIATLDGGYAVTGLSATTDGSGDVSDNHGSFDYWLTKLDEDGNLEWQKSYGGSGTEQSFGLVQNADSSYVICGYSSSPNTGMVTGNHGENDYWIVKADKNGELVWQRSYGGSGSDRAFGISITSDNGYIINGVSPSTDGDVTGNHGDNDYWIVKLNADGDLQWEKCYGGTGDDFGRVAFEISGGDYMLGGRTNTLIDGDVSHNHGDYDYWVVIVDHDGVLLSERCFGVSKGEGAPPSLVPFMNIVELSPKNYIMTGCTFSTDGDVQGNLPVDSLDDNYWVVRFGEDEDPPPPDAVQQAENTEHNLHIFPDPAYDLITIQLPDHQGVLTISLYASDGKKIAVYDVEENKKMQISGASLVPGRYEVILQDENGARWQSSFIKL